MYFKKSCFTAWSMDTLRQCLQYWVSNINRVREWMLSHVCFSPVSTYWVSNTFDVDYQVGIFLPSRYYQTFTNVTLELIDYNWSNRSDKSYKCSYKSYKWMLSHVSAQSQHLGSSTTSQYSTFI